MDLDFPFDYLTTSCKAIAVLFKLKCSQLKKKNIERENCSNLIKTIFARILCSVSMNITLHDIKHDIDRQRRRWMSWKS